MNIVDEIYDFFVRLIRGRIDSVHIQAKSKMMGVQHKAKAAASRQFNGAIDGAIGKAKGTVTGKPQEPQGKPPIGRPQR